MQIPFATPGEMPSRNAAVQNAVYDAARANLQQDHDVESERPLHTFPLNQNDQIWVRNDCNATISRYSIVGIDEPIWLPEGSEAATSQFMNDPIFSVKIAEYCRHRGRWAVLVQPLKPGEVGKAVFSGSSVVWWKNETNPYSNTDGEFEDTGSPKWIVSSVAVGLQEPVWPRRFASDEEISMNWWLGQQQRPVTVLDYDNPTDEDGRLSWAGETFLRNNVSCGGSMDLVCDSYPTVLHNGTVVTTTPTWRVQRHGCDEGCTGLVASNIPAGTCTLGNTILDVPCYAALNSWTASPIGLMRFGPGSRWLTHPGGSTPSNSCECRSRSTRYECRDDGAGWQWYVVHTNCGSGCSVMELAEIEAIWPGVYSCGPDVPVKDVTRHCDWTTTTTTTTTTTLPPSTTTTTTTTTLPPSTTTTTTTTTTAVPCSGVCWHDCVYLNPSPPGIPGWYWATSILSACGPYSPPCACYPPTVNCDPLVDDIVNPTQNGTCA